MSYSCNASQKAYIRQAILSDVRLDGRQNAQLRKSHVTKGILHQAQGSALLTAAAENLTVYSSIKLQVVRKCNASAFPETEVSVESVKQNDRYGTSRETEEDLQVATIYEILSEMYVAHLKLSAFSIATSQQYTLKLYIDAFLMSYPHVSQLDLIVQSLRASLEDLKIPQFVVMRNEITTEEDLEVTYDTLGYPDIAQLPDVFLVGYVEGNLVCDMTQEEFECVDSLFVFSVRNEEVLNFRQLTGAISPEVLLKVTKFAVRVSQTRKSMNLQNK